MELTRAEAGRRAARTDWTTLAAGLDELGGAPTGPLLTRAAQSRATGSRAVRAAAHTGTGVP
ncbi:hypothetical protein AB0E10_21245 [Streptomyces sp. NPDC048045]|uniref:hypothetical protein n=1 Tax=Streptomyces sp. NPDC048045 TaxID=3154710 RepID=UPI0034274BEE